jgi:hypothetical protein
LAVESSCRPERSCSAVERPITHRGWCGLGDGLDVAAARLHRHLEPEALRDNHIIFDAGARPLLTMIEAMLTLAEAAASCRDLSARCRLVLTRGSDPYADSAGGAAGGSPGDLDGLLARISDFDLEIGFAASSVGSG